MADRRPRLRLRFKRLVLLLALVLAVLLLFELHRWLPGSWPGGGGASGFRRLDAPAATDPTRVVAPVAASPDWTADDGTTLRVHGPAGAPAAGWRVGVGSRGALEGAQGAESLLTRDPALWREGLRVRFAGGEVRHAAPAGAPPTPHVRVDLPAATVTPLRQSGDVEVRVVDALSGEPLADVRLAVEGLQARPTTDADGRARLRGLREPRPLTVEAAGHSPRRLTVHPQGPASLEVRLDPQREVDLLLVDPDTGLEAEVQSARLFDARGAPLGVEWDARQPRPARLRGKVPAGRLEGAWVHVAAPGRPLSRLPVSGPTGTLALARRGRAIEVHARDVQGRPIPASEVRLTFAIFAPVAADRESVGGQMTLGVGGDDPRLVLTVPADDEHVLIVESDGHAPAALRIAPGDSPGSRDVVLEAGVRVPVLVQDLHGRPLRGAQVVATCVLGGFAVHREATTDAEGRARVGPVPPGPVEIRAHAAGHAWGQAAAEALATMGTVALRLEPGARINLVVHSPLGAPLEGVRVDLLPSDDGPPDVQPPVGPRRRSSTDAQGLLVLEDLAVRSYRLRLSLAEHAEELLEDVRPGAITYFASLVPLPGR